MDNRIEKLLSLCSRVGFGTVENSREEKIFRSQLNREMLLLCRSLPESKQTEAVLFLAEHLKTPFRGGFDFMDYFYTPAWSILFWLLQSSSDNNRPAPEYVSSALKGHVMAMFLHALDDHLIDGQLPFTHLSLLIRSQAWMIMNLAFEQLSKEVEKGAELVHGFFNDYYLSISLSNEFESLEEYCAIFKKQMATWLVVPVLVARKICADEAHPRAVEAAYCSFGVAWRLLDDLQDMEKDMDRGVHSSIYVCLNENIKQVWNKNANKYNWKNDKYRKIILDYIIEESVVYTIIERACSELETAASLTDACFMPELADEFRSLSIPLRKERNRT